MDNIALLILGVFISFLGIVNIMGNISTIHSYNRRRVKEEDVPKYGRAVGTGTLIIGVSLIVAFVTAFWSEKAMSFIVIPALVIGLGFILYAQFKYNKGIFYSKSTRYFPTCSHNFPKAGEARFQGRSRLFRLLGKFPYLGESRRILMAVSSKTSSKTRFYYAATRRISSAAVQPSIWA